ncbi:MAG: hypothetical protein Q4G04_05725 [bacterium]|nr:hypothetical protein [bacterium]
MKNKIEIVEITEEKLPFDATKDCKLFYDYGKRTRGGFTDAIFLTAIIATAGLWFMIVVFIINKG